MIENENSSSRPTAQTVSAFLMLVAGIALNFFSFFTPPQGELADSAVAFMGEALIYAASVFGLTAYIDTKLKNLKNEKDKIHCGTLHGWQSEADTRRPTSRV